MKNSKTDLGMKNSKTDLGMKNSRRSVVDGYEKRNGYV